MVRARRRGLRRGARVRRGGRRRLRPVVTWLRSEAFAARLRRLDPADLTELSRLLPELQAPRPEPLPEAERRRRLFAALAQALLAPGPPLLLVADDLHWFDVPTLQFLHYLLRTEPAAPLLVAATARREEIDARHPVGELFAGLQARGRFTEIGLARLSRGDTALLAERMTGARLGEAEAERLFAESEGNPLFLVEAVQAGPERRRRQPGPGRDRGAARPALGPGE